MLRLSLLILCVFSLLFVPAQNKDDADLSTPYATIQKTYFENVRGEGDIEIAAQCFPLNNKERNVELAKHLSQILNSKGIRRHGHNFPKDSLYKDSLTNAHKYVPFPNEFPQIYVVRKQGKWRFAEESVQAIPQLHDKIFPFGSDLLVNIFPAFGQKEFLGLKIWQYVGLLLILSISLLVYSGLITLLKFIVHRYSHLFETKQEDVILRKIVRPLSGFFVIFLVRLLLPILQLPAGLNHYLVICLHVLQPLFAVIFFYRCIDVLDLYLTRIAERSENTLDDQLMPLLRKSLKVIVIIVGGLFILQNLDFNITTLLAGISIGGLAFALAAQDTIKNFFGSLMIFIDRPFQVGDWVHFDNSDGTIEEVGFRSTRVRTFANSVISIPNGRMADMKIDNLGLRQYRRFYTEIALPFHTPPHLLETYVEGLRDYVRQHPHTRKDFFEIHLNSMTDHSLNVIFYIFLDVPSWSDELKVRHEVILTITKLADELGIQFAYPTQTQQVETFPGSQPIRPSYEQDPAKAKEKVAAFLKGGQDQQ